jgi:hypothetical protein
MVRVVSFTWSYLFTGALLMHVRLLRLFLVTSAIALLLLSAFWVSTRFPTRQPSDSALALGFGAHQLVVVQSVAINGLSIAVFFGFMWTLIMVVEYWRAWKVLHPQKRPITYALSAATTIRVARAPADCQQRIQHLVAIYPDLELKETSMPPSRLRLDVRGDGWWSGEQITIDIHALDAHQSDVQLVSESRNRWQIGDLGKNADHIEHISRYLNDAPLGVVAFVKQAS